MANVPSRMSLGSFALEAALGRIPGYGTLFKFGEALDCDSGVDTDIWDGADGVTSTDVWVPPTQARIHNITSTSIADDGAPLGTGLRTLRVYGLTDWDTKEVNEDIIMDGTTPVATTNSYVIIHRMHGLTYGSGGANAGIITATAATDATITAAIQVGNNQTLMAIYGFPSTQKLCITQLTSAMLGTATASADMKFLIRSNADQSDSGFRIVTVYNIDNAGSWIQGFDPPEQLSGPMICKVQANSNTNNSIITSTFSGYLVDI